MEKAVGVVRFRPAPDFDRLRAIMHEEPREVIAQGKHFLNHAAPDKLTQARTYNLLCYTSACILKRSAVEAAYHGHEAVELARQVEGVEGKAVLFDSLVNFGSASERIGEYDRSVEAYREALAMPLDWLDRRQYEEAVVTYLGRALSYKGDYGGAIAAFDQAGALAAARQDRYAHEFLYNLRGICHMKRGDLEAAEQFIAMAATVTNDETRYELGPKGQILGSMAVLRMLQARLAEAEEYAKAALEIATAVEDPHGQVEGKLVLAYCAKASRRVHPAADLAGEASRIAFAYGYIPLIQELTWLMGHIYPQGVRPRETG